MSRRRPVSIVAAPGAWSASLSTLAARLFLVCVFAFMLCPLVVVLWLSLFKDPIITFPPTGYTLQWYWRAASSRAFSTGLLVSVQVALVAAVLGVTLGLAAALGLTRYRFVGAEWINTLLLSPMLIPGIVAGIALYLLYLAVENLFDVDIAGTYVGLIAAHTCLVLPWSVRLLSASLIGLDRSAEEAAENLGASKPVAFFRVTLPMLRPALIAAACFGFVVSFENLELSLSLVGPGRTTLPIAIMQYLEFQLDPTIAAVASIQIGLLTVAMLIADRCVKLSQVI